MAKFIPTIHVLRLSALKQGVDARVKPGHDESREQYPKGAIDGYSAGGSAGGVSDGVSGGVSAAFRFAAFFSTIETAMIEPS